MRWEVLASLVLVVSTAGTAAAGFGLQTKDDPAETRDPSSATNANQPGHAYHTWETLTLELQQLVQENPEIARLHSAGESVLGLDLWVVEIANFRDEDRKPIDQREVVWLDGGTHANEQLGTELAFDWVEFLLEDYDDNETATWIVDNRHTFIMPMVNPDGNHKDSRQNARGVNINRNYPVGWGATEESATGDNPGPYPLSEPETETVVEWWEKTEPDYMNSFHTGFEAMLTPWAWQDSRTPDREVYQRICEEIGEPDRDFCGPVQHIIHPTGGGSIDTSYERWGSISFAYELSDENSLYASVEDPRTRLQRFWDGVEHAFLNVEKYGAHPTVEDATIGDDEIELTVENDGYGNLTHGHATLHVRGSQPVLLDLPEIPSGQQATVRAPVDADSASDGRLEVFLDYQERQVAGAMEERVYPLPVAIQDGTLVEAPLSENVTGEVLSGQSADGELAGVPGLGAAVAGLTLAAGALFVRRR